VSSYYPDEIDRIEAARDEILERPMPNSFETERAIIGSIILDNELYWKAREQGIIPEMFYTLFFREAYRYMDDLAELGIEINQVNLGEEFKRGGNHQAPVSRLTETMVGIPHSADISHFVKTLREKFWSRQLIKLCNKIAADTYDEDDSLPTLVGNAETMILELANNALRGNGKLRGIDFVHILKDKQDFIETLDKRSQGIQDALPSGIRPIDNKLEGGGFNPQGFYLVAAQPKAGKTSLVLSWAERIARTFAEIFETEGIQQSVAVASLEMRRLALQMRLFSAYTSIPFDTLSRPGKLRGVDREIAFSSVDSFFNFPLYINDAVFTLPELWRACERVVYGPMQAKLIIVDYLQLVSLRKGYTADPDKLTGEVTIVSRELKHMATELNVPVIGISSLNRLGEIRQSGSVEYDVEALFRLENPDYDPKMALEARAELDAKPVWDINARLAYQRNGVTGDIMLKFIRQQMKFVTASEYEKNNGSSKAQDLNELWLQS
jgi:replicative DNA helicase